MLADVTLCGSEFQTETAEEEKDVDCAMVLFLQGMASLEATEVHVSVVIIKKMHEAIMLLYLFIQRCGRNVKLYSKHFTITN